MTNHQDAIQSLRNYLNHHIIGQPLLIDRLLIALLADGHLLVEGAPGLAKTKAIKLLSQGIEGDFQRVQFTPDLLPTDITGTEVYRPTDGSFHFQKGPIFHNLVLADEINRAPAKVQSALLEAMAERQVSIGNTTHTLPSLFMVMATQNPIEQEGTYPLPEAQLDRFLLHVKIDYPDHGAEQKILKLARQEALNQDALSGIAYIDPIKQSTIFSIRKEILGLHMTPAIEEYIVQLILATRESQKYSQELKKWLEYGASPRATIGLDRCARAHAWLQKRDFVTPEDVQKMAHDILRHRIILSYEAEATGITTDEVINQLLEKVPAP